MFEISYHKKIVDDISNISTSNKIAISKAIEEKLTSDPEFFGKPLQFSLTGLRSLRVGDYRIVFQLKKKEVFVVFIGHRSVVYTLVSKRI
ncbi:MAG: type II toxin-antitoxin system RelE/ParE family toxin [Candidatus Yonathbacteria bacterium]|nr:type II toxin-antitoxin system RelE/ParE family toxin [Candidatus Yonathbacteria bacterium]